MAIVLLCPGCSTRLSRSDDSSETAFNCPRCDCTMTVPESICPPLPPPTFVDYSSRKRNPTRTTPTQRRKKGSPWLAFLWLGIAGVVVSGFLYWAVNSPNSQTQSDPKTSGTDVAKTNE